MRLNVNLVALSFVVIIIVIFMADSIASAVLIITLIVNFVAICIHLSSIECDEPVKPSSIDIAVSDATAASIGPPVMADAPSGYGAEYDTYSHVNEFVQQPTAFPLQYGPAEGVVGGDAANVIMAQRRTRDKRAMTAAATKTAEYYKYHFADELSEAEGKRWWGANDY